MNPPRPGIDLGPLGSWREIEAARERFRSEPGATLVAPALPASEDFPGLAEFERTLAAQDNATAALGEWCRMRGIADPAAIRAERFGGSPDAPPEVRRLLEVSDAEPLAFRHVRLCCGDAVLSEAENWYVPARLAPEMTSALAASDVPFGQVVAPLRFTRERLFAQRGECEGCPPGTVLSHRALLRLPDGTPLSLVTECYTREAIQDPPAGEGPLPAIS